MSICSGNGAPGTVWPHSNPVSISLIFSSSEAIWSLWDKASISHVVPASSLIIASLLPLAHRKFLYRTFKFEWSSWVIKLSPENATRFYIYSYHDWFIVASFVLLFVILDLKFLTGAIGNFNKFWSICLARACFDVGHRKKLFYEHFKMILKPFPAKILVFSTKSPIPPFHP